MGFSCDGFKNRVTSGFFTLICMCVLMFVLMGIAIAAEPAPIQEMQYVIAEDTEAGTSRMSVYCLLPEDTALPAIAHFYVPSDFEFEYIFGLSLDEDAGDVEVPFTMADEGNGFVRYDVTFNEGIFLIAGFMLDAKMYDTTAMGNASNTPIVQLEVLPPNDLEFLTVGFVAPEGYTGVGQEVTRLGTDEDGNEVYGIDYVDVLGGEVITAVVAFGQPPESSEFNADPTLAASTLWFMQPFVLIVGTLVLIVVGLGVLLYIKLTRKSISPSSDDEETSVDQE